MVRKIQKRVLINSILLALMVVMGHTNTLAQSSEHFVTMKVGDSIVGKTAGIFISEDPDGSTLIDMEKLKFEGITVMSTSSVVGFNCLFTSTDIKITGNFKYLECILIGLSELYTGNNPDLVTLRCEVNYLKTLDLSNNPKIAKVVCNRNQIERLEISNCKGITLLDCGNNLLTELDLSKNNNLVKLYCMENKLQTLDLSTNKKLSFLSCPNNLLSNILISQDQPLTYCAIFGNQLSATETGKIISNLPTHSNQSKGKLIVINTKNSQEKNVCYKEDVRKALAKNWDVFDNYGQENDYGIPYEGSEPTDIENITLSNVSYYPNPAKEYVIVQTTPNKQVSITTIDGKVCFDSVADINGKCYINLASLSSGVYFIKTDHGVEKLIIE